MATQGVWGRWSPSQRWSIAIVALLVVVNGLILFGLLRSGTDPAPNAVADPAPATATGEDTADESAAPTVDAPDDSTSTATATAAAPTNDAQDCVSITVWTAPHLEPAVQAAAERVTDGCFRYAVAPHADASAQAALRGGERPDVWIPGSAAWPGLVAQDGVQLQVGETIASSPVLLAGAPPVISALEQMGIGPETSWAQVVQQVQESRAAGEQAPFEMRIGDPRSDAATMSLLSTTGSQTGGWTEQDSPQRGMLVLLAHTSIPDDPLTALVADPTTVVPATERQLGAAQEAGREVAGLALADGLGQVQIPFVRVGDGSEEGVDALEEQLTSSDAAADLQELWLRPGTSGPAPEVEGVPDDVPATATEVDPATVPLTAQTWAAISRQSRILTAIDISLSMTEEVGDTTRVDLTREAAQAALQTIPPRTAVGVWYFATALEGTQDWTEVAPLRPLGERVDGGTQRELLMSVTDELGVDTLTGDTGLHDTLWAAYQKMQEEWTPEAVSSVLLLTDGKNNDTTGGLTADEVVELLSAAHAAGDRPVTVVLIGMGPEVNEAALDRLASAAGGVSIVLRDPRDLPQVFVEVVAQRTSSATP
ncbi:VWA domain-containing protein [Ornithinimicrobium pratense]|uniref:VWA domain-containing protein n=1 Tax=Ornithinimicrobium pratense TaxID=2593973 RepID=A0A5J6V9P8_9MICO|nr:VWA domain-containing protein [Ornithinimicrobium pratense]QFG69762.1 VWA domain-containing protein [Ornithinimicrobium pratense]